MRVFYLSLFILIADQLSKFFVKGLSIPFLGISIKGINYGSSINIINNVFEFTLIENPGMAFGIEFGGKLLRTLFTTVAAAFVIYLIYKNRNKSLYLRLSLAFILGGALGNLINRIFYGVLYGYESLFYGDVIDFIHILGPQFKLFGRTYESWPIFNIADLAVTIGFVMLLIGHKKIFLRRAESNEFVNEPEENKIGSVVNSESNNTNQNSTATISH